PSPRLPSRPRSPLFPYTTLFRSVGFSGHADLAAEAGADVVFVVNLLVRNLQDGNGNASMTARGMYTIMEQAGRIYSQNLLTLGLATLAVKFPRTADRKSTRLNSSHV